ncbi:MAG: elongation factor G, partial [bacterium]
ALLFAMKQNSRLGSVSDGTSLLDYDEDEVARKIGINLALGYGEYRDTLFNLVDAPGYADFFGNVVSAARAIDSAVIVVDASSGVEVGTELAWRRVEQSGCPRVVFVNKLRKENTDFAVTVEEIRKALGASVTPLYLPVGREGALSGVVDLLAGRAFAYDNGTRTEVPVPAALADDIAAWRERLVEAAADADEKLMEKFLEGAEISTEEMINGVRNGIRAGVVHPLVCGDALAQVGVDMLLDLAVDVLPAPTGLKPLDARKPDSDEAVLVERKPDAPTCALVFKTISESHVGEMSYVRVLSGSIEPGMTLLNATTGRDEKINQLYIVKGRERTEVSRLVTGMVGALVKLKDTRTGNTLCDRRRPVVLPELDFPRPSISVAIVPHSKGDEERVSNGLTRLRQEDPTFSFAFDPELGQQLISGMGELHLDVIVGRLKRRFDVSVDLIKPRIAYRETISRKADAQGRHKKQTGGRGQFGDCYLRIEPLPRGGGFEFVDEIKGGAIPGKFVPSVEKGVRELLDKGVLAGYRMMDIRATVYDGSFHPVDSSDIAFKMAAILAFKACCEKAGVILLEPIANVEITAPDRYTGDIMGDLNAKRGRIAGMESQGSLQVIKAQVPQAEMYKYSNALRSMTQGRGFFAMEFSHYEEVPREQTARIVDEAKAQREEEKQ